VANGLQVNGRVKEEEENMKQSKMGLLGPMIALAALLAVPGCAQKETKKPAPEQQASTAASAEDSETIGAVSKSSGKSKIETQVPSVTQRSTQADINRMSAGDFIALGLNEESAQKVLEYRRENGNFTSVDQLNNVPGIDTAWVSRMQSKLGVS